MTSRYFHLTDSTMLEAVKKNRNQVKAAEEKAQEFADQHGLGTPGFIRWSLFDSKLHGFKTNNSSLELDGWFVRPKDGYTRPRVKKGSPILEQFKTLVNETHVNDSELSKILGWSSLDFFPCRPGLYANYKSTPLVVVFVTNESTTSLPGCVEISNIEYLQLKENARGAA